MSDYRPLTIPERNPETYRIHRTEVFWQITIPLLLAALVVLALAFLTVLVGKLDVGKLADVSLIWLILPAMATGLVILILVGAFAFATIWLIRKVPVYARKAQTFIISVSSTIKNLTDAIVEPILRVQSFLASARAVLKR